MMVGHEMVAFALVAGAAALSGWTRERALAAGAAAAGFALVPDADMVYALFGLVRSDYTGVFAVTSSFWGASAEAHRSATHSLVVGVPAGLAFSLWTLRGRRAQWGRAAAVSLLSTLVVVAYLASGPVDAGVMGVFAVAGIAVATAVRRRTDLPAWTVLAAALAGLLTHPFGDVFTGTPPLLFYPLEGNALGGLVVLHPDPTIHLLGVFGLELATVWLAAVVYLAVQGDRSPRTLVDRTALLGVCYAPAALVLPPPTLDVSYHFVFSILAVGGVVAAPSIRGFPGVVSWWAGEGPNEVGPTGTDGDAENPAATLAATLGGREAPGLPARGVNRLLTGVTAVTLAWLGYLVVYLVA